MLGAEAIDRRARWLGLALAAATALAAASALPSTSSPRETRAAGEPARVEDIERLREEVAAQAELGACLIRLHARCEVDCLREAERAHRSCPARKADPAALARKARMDELRAWLDRGESQPDR